MRILFDARQKLYKEVFGCLTPNQSCPLHIHIPQSVKTRQVFCVVTGQDGAELDKIPLVLEKTYGDYDIFGGNLVLTQPGLYFYYFLITGHTGTFRLFRQGKDTNMEAGDCWQVSCIPEDFTTPDWAKGAVIYQVFPDRFAKEGLCDLTGKPEPYLLHGNWEEELCWQPTETGEVLNNDFYGGNFRGIMGKLDYLASLGVGILYLNPISKSFSSHRYDTGDYKTPDPMLGTMEEFKELCRQAHQRNIRVILDGVYSHTGSESIYFDKSGKWGGKGAYQDPQSPYRSWYRFYEYPNCYHSWWNFDTLPTVNKLDPAFLEYIITGESSVVAHWLAAGADGFRLDVADELPNEFMDLFKKRVRQIKPDALVMGEVWEDASNKIAYDVRRRYFVDGTLDSVMNYPFRNALVDFVTGADGGEGFVERVETILENYPRQVVHCNMNLLGTHDTPRILSVLHGDYEGSRAELAAKRMTETEYAAAVKKLRLASVMQYALPGCPSLYYGDEAGMEGGKDPFNRRTFPWGREDTRLQTHFGNLGCLRKALPAWRRGETLLDNPYPGCLRLTRKTKDQTVHLYVNWRQESWSVPTGRLLLAEGIGHAAPGYLTLDGYGWCVVEE